MSGSKGNNTSAPNSKGKKKSKNNNNNDKKSDGMVSVSNNTISQNTKAGARRPMTRSVANGTVLTHTETYGVNITGSAAFETIATFAVQPGITTYQRGSPLGQWLPQIAQNFDNYEIQSLKFNFRSACSTLEPGLVVMGFEPNPEGTTPSSYQELRNMYSVDGSVHANLSLDVSRLVRRPLLIRKRAVINLPSYDAGKIYISTIGCTDNAKLGFVDVSYSIRLFNPQSSNTTTSSIPVVFSPCSPCQLIRVTGVSSSTINVADNSNDVLSTLLNNALTIAGSTLVLSGAFAAPAMDHNYNGFRFKDVAAVRNHWQILSSGRYRLKYDLNLDFQDLGLFCSAPFTRLPAQSWTIAQRQIVNFTDGTDVSYIDVTPMGHRGFSGTAVGDPNPATDLPMWGDYEIACVAGSFLTVAVGVQTYNNISTTTANVKFVAGRGYQGTFTLNYLGPLEVGF